MPDWGAAVRMQIDMRLARGHIATDAGRLVPSLGWVRASAGAGWRAVTASQQSDQMLAAEFGAQAARTSSFLGVAAAQASLRDPGSTHCVSYRKPTMKRSLIALFAATLSFGAWADGQSDCDAAQGSYLTGTVVSAPTFARATSSIQGVKLSHTHVSLRADQDGQVYDVAMDNVYASDFVRNASTMPRSLAAIKVNDRLELCGALYTSGVGIHWVHSNCGATPASNAPDGWVKHFNKDGSVGSNLEGSENYCYLWN